MLLKICSRDKVIGSLSGKWTESPWVGRVDSFGFVLGLVFFSLFKCVFGGEFIIECFQEK